MTKEKLGKYIVQYSEKNKSNESYPVYSVTNSQGFCTDYFNKDMSSVNKKGYKIVPKGYFAYNPSRINVGSIDWQKHEENVIISPLYVVFKCSNGLDKDYLLYFLKSDYGLRLINQSTLGSVRDNLKFEILSQFEFCMRSLGEQKKAISNLRSIEFSIELEQKQIELYDELVKAEFHKRFINKNYPLTTLKKISLGNAEYGAASASVDFTENRPRYIRITDIKNDGSLNDDRVCSINTDDDFKYKLSYGDFMFARMGATVGKTYMYKEGNQIFAGYLIKYKLNTTIVNPYYLFWYSKQDQYLEWIEINQRGSAQPGINAEKYNTLPIIIAPINLQNEFERFAEKIESLKALCYKRINLYTELLKRKTDEYFNPEV
jgi:type I restriction enzyme, S subunit